MITQSDTDEKVNIYNRKYKEDNCRSLFVESI